MNRDSGPPPIHRREFLNLLGVAAASIALPGRLVLFSGGPQRWPTLQVETLPNKIRDILWRVPRTSINPSGNLVFHGRAGRPVTYAPLYPTQWNIERNRPTDRLDPRFRWGIVLHWFGEDEDLDLTIDGYLRGFDSVRQVESYLTRTSAHFLVGANAPNPAAPEDGISIAQMQSPAEDGHPFVASHVQPIDFLPHNEQEQYFVRAYYTLGPRYGMPETYSLLQSMFDGPYADPNTRTLAIELVGADFDNPNAPPANQTIANTVSLLLSLMKRYRIPVLDVLGHNEIQLGKADPGKKFMALIRFLLGLQALIDPDPLSAELVFAPFTRDEDKVAAVERYFQFVWDYAALVCTPRQVFEWEDWSQYWLFMDRWRSADRGMVYTDNVSAPLRGAITHHNHQFLVPANHEGIDLGGTSTGAVYTIAGGQCLYQGQILDPHWKNVVMFGHKQENGARYISIFGHLEEMSVFQTGEFYPTGQVVGRLEENSMEKPSFLHLAIAYGATWDTDLKFRPIPPPNAGPTWIRSRFFPPEEFFQRYLVHREVRRAYEIK